MLLMWLLMETFGVINYFSKCFYCKAIVYIGLTDSSSASNILGHKAKGRQHAVCLREFEEQYI